MSLRWPFVGRTSAAALAGATHSVSNTVLEMLGSEKDRWRLWLPVGLGIGVATYFGLMFEPPRWLAAAGAASALLGVVLARRRPLAVVSGLAVLLLTLGLGIAQWHAGDVAAPKLLKQLYARNVEGRVVELWALPKGQRLRLGSLSIAGLGPAETPKYVRVTTRRSGAVSVGDRVRLRASLRPPSWPALPGSFDFERKAFFEQIGAYGFTLGAVSVIASENNAGLLARLSIGLNRLRQEIGLRIRTASSPSSGAIAQALMTGDRGSIVDADLEVMRDSGLAHLLAISGLHMGLMAATLFFVMRTLLALVDWRCRQRWRCVTRSRNMPPSDPWLAHSPILR